MIRNHRFRQVVYNLWQDLLVNLPCRKGIGKSFVDIPLTDLLIILVVPAEDDERRMMPKSLDIRDGFLFYRVHKFRVRWIDATRELEVLQEVPSLSAHQTSLSSANSLATP